MAPSARARHQTEDAATRGRSPPARRPDSASSLQTRPPTNAPGVWHPNGVPLACWPTQSPLPALQTWPGQISVQSCRQGNRHDQSPSIRRASSTGMTRGCCTLEISRTPALAASSPIPKIAAATSDKSTRTSLRGRSITRNPRRCGCSAQVLDQRAEQQDYQPCHINIRRCYGVVPAVQLPPGCG